MTDPLDPLIDRYVAGECSAPERDRVVEWLGNDPERHARLSRAKAVWDAAHALDPVWDVDLAWQRMRRAMPDDRDAHVASLQAPHSTGRLEDRSSDVQRTSRGPTRAARRTGLATAAAVLLGIAILMWRIFGIGEVARAPQVITTGPQQRASVQLPDGSHVVIGPESRLVELAGFGASARRLELTGTAYFDVVHDASHPFVVMTQRLRIRDLGTRFAVDAYVERTGAGEEVRVAVASGAVEIAPAPDGSCADDRQRLRAGPCQRASPPAAWAPRVVDAGHVGRLDTQGRLVVRETAVDQYVSWTTGDLSFDDVPLSEAVSRLDHWYGARIRVGDPALACRHITATFHDESLTEALDAMDVALHMVRVVSGDSTTLVPLAPERDRARPGRTPTLATECEGHPNTP